MKRLAWRGLWLAAALCAAPALAETVKGSAVIVGTPMLVELQTGDGIATLRHRPADNSAGWTRRVIHGPADALAILADTRLVFLWPAIDRFAGEDLALLRDRAVERTRAGFAAGKPTGPADGVGENAMSGWARALIEHVDALRGAGRYEAAVALLEPQVAAMAPGNDRERFEYFVAAGALFDLHDRLGAETRAEAVLREAKARLGEHPFAVNIELTLAAWLGERGRGEEALVLADAARARFGVNTGRAQEVPGANAQLDWIRACALASTGRRDEALALMAAVENAPQPTMRKVRLPRLRDQAQRGWQCIHDPARLAALWQRDLAEGPAIGAMTFVLAQPGSVHGRRDATTVEAARAAFTPAAPYRTLPERYRPALAAWR